MAENTNAANTQAAEQTSSISPAQNNINAGLENEELNAKLAELSWEDLEREDLKYLTALEVHGWAARFSKADLDAGNVAPEQPPVDPVRYERGFSLVYQHKYESGEVAWNVVDNQGPDHARKYKSILDVIESEV